tara:strand:+ start:77 stop:604 length:528 start_codon:yes stop_codon:yes gene_type:complete
MFKIPIYTYKVENWIHKKSLLLDICYDANFYLDEKTNVYTDYGKNDDYKFNVSNILESDISRFHDDIELNSVYVTDLWFQKYNLNQFHTIHNHGALGYSSILFLKYDKNVHKPTRFVSPFMNAKGETDTYVPDVDEGTIIFFPSMVNHYTIPNQTRKTRIILSFNIKEYVAKKKN